METSANKAMQNAGSSEMGQRVSVPNVWSFVAAAALAVFYLATSIYVASHRLFYFDEVLTVHLARLPHCVSIWAALAHGADGQPPLHYMSVRIFDKLFAPGEVAVRLPSALAMVAGLLIIFDCARRLTNGLHGLIALSVLIASFLPYYGYDARPYAILFMFAALSLWVWTCTPERIGSAICFGAVFFLGVAFHYYFFLCVVPFVLWEIVRWKPGKRPSRKLIAGLVGVALSAVLLSPFIMSFTHKFSASLVQVGISLRGLMDVFSFLFPGGLFLLGLIAIWIVLVNRKNTSLVLQPMQASESVGWLFLCIPLAGFVAAKLKTNAFAARYFVGVVPGVAVAFSCFVWRRFRNASFISLGIFLILATWGLAKQVHVVRHADAVTYPGTHGHWTEDYLSLEGQLRIENKRFSVFSDPFLFLTAQYYSRNECILLVPSGFKQNPNFVGWMPLRFVLGLSDYYPLKFGPPYELREHPQETALIKPTPEVLDTLNQAGFQVTVRFPKPLEVVYLK